MIGYYLLLELFTNKEVNTNMRYSELKENYFPEHDHYHMAHIEDGRKTRLTLKQINKARKAGEFHKDEQQKELTFVRNMYGAANQPEV